MLPLVLALSVGRRPGPLGGRRGRSPRQHQAGDDRLRPRRRGLLLARRHGRSSSRPRRRTRGNPFYQIFVHGPGDRPAPPRQPRRRQDDLRVLLARRQEDHLRQQPPRPRRARSTTPPSTSSARKSEGRRQRRRYNWDFDPYMEIFEANPDGSGLKRLTDAKATTPRAAIRPTASRSSSAPTAPARRTSSCTSWTPTARTSRQLTHAPNCYNGGPFFSPDGTKRHLPQRPQEEGPPAALRHQRRRHRREGADRQRQLGLLGPVLVQGRQAHHLHRRRPQRPDGPAELRPVLDGHRHGQDGRG